MITSWKGVDNTINCELKILREKSKLLLNIKIIAFIN